MTPEQRGKRVANAVLEGILPRLELRLGPVDLDALAASVAREIREAVAEAHGQRTLFSEEVHP